MNEESAETLYTFKLGYAPIVLFEKCAIPDKHLTSVDLDITIYGKDDQGRTLDDEGNKIIAEKEYFKIIRDFDLTSKIDYYRELKAKTHEKIPDVAKYMIDINAEYGKPMPMSAARSKEIRNAVTLAVGEDVFTKYDSKHISVYRILTSKQIAQIIRNIIAPYQDEDKKPGILPEITAWYHEVPESIVMNSGLPDSDEDSRPVEDYITLKDKDFKRWKIVNKSIQPDYSSLDFHEI